MDTLEKEGAALSAFAELLSYPATDPRPVALRCRALVGSRARRHLDTFVAEAEQSSRSGLEEAYSSAFDLMPACAPYVGYHLFGDGPLRGEFLARLAEVYAQAGFVPGGAGGELGDHLSVVLRFLAAAPRGEGGDDLRRDGLVPALEKMLLSLGDQDNVYRSVLEALREEVR